jgi:CRISPR/Cas system CMR subunit Cmr4 (Cas7 group RAMP superfamily)
MPAYSLSSALAKVTSYMQLNKLKTDLGQFMEKQKCFVRSTFPT